MRNDAEVVIIGGGLGGLALGLALHRQGVPVAVLEARAAPAVDMFGFTLWPPGTRTLDWLDLLAPIESRGCVLEHLAWRTPDGSELAAVPLHEYRDSGGPFLGVLPSAVERVLSDEADRVGLPVRRGASDWALERQPDARIELRVDPAGGGPVYRPRLVVGADGPRSAVRSRVGLGARFWQPPRQALVTGIADGAPTAESSQTMGPGWSIGSIDVGAGSSWQYGIFRVAPADSGGPRTWGDLAHSAVPDAVRAVAAGLRSQTLLRPSSVRVRRWAVDGVVVFGDAAHGTLPHLGLGGSMTLSSVPVLADVIIRALAINDMSAGRLAEFQRQHEPRVRHARRACELWALGCTVPGFISARDLNLRRLGRRAETLRTFVRAMSGSERPSLRCRSSVWLP